jgi:lysophospholipase L1-like esterase
MIRERWWIGVLVLLTISATGSGGQEFALHEGDRVVFYGDSITAQRLYTRFVEDFVLTRYPQMHISFSNAGVPGDTVYGGYTGDVPTRLARDVLPHQPTVVTLMLGMNDGYYMDFNPKYLEVFKDGYRKLLDSLQGETPAPRITLITPTPYDEVTHGTEFAHYNETVSHYSGAVKELAVASHLGFTDFNQVETELLNGGLRKDSSLAALLVPDRIHPAEASHWVMAAAIARSWGLSPMVSSVQLDAALGGTDAAENTQGFRRKIELDADRQGTASALGVGRWNDSVCYEYLRPGRDGPAVASRQGSGGAALRTQDRWKEDRFVHA